MRTDPHHPSVIVPEDYEYVAIEFVKIEAGDFGTCLFLQAERARIRAHMEETGGTYSHHEHGGNCHICGAWAIYTTLFYHQKTNSYIRTGFDCAGKLEMGADFNALARVKKEIKCWRDLQTGKTRALGYLTEIDLEDAYAIYDDDMDLTTLRSKRIIKSAQWQLNTLKDIIGKLVKYGSISEKQVAFVRKLTDQLQDVARRDDEAVVEDAAETARLAKLPDMPEGRYEITGEIVSIKQYGDEYYGDTWYKMLVKTDEGYKYWGSLPAALNACERGDRVTFRGKVTRSDDDRLFGFYSRPTKAVSLNQKANELKCSGGNATDQRTC
jgi:hypothetical protein|tara:strand:+ start:93 stop:1067 length:975 start_codon:yes stop_codon:yes gene_type:complete